MAQRQRIWPQGAVYARDQARRAELHKQLQAKRGLDYLKPVLPAIGAAELKPLVWRFEQDAFEAGTPTTSNQTVPLALELFSADTSLAGLGVNGAYWRRFGRDLDFRTWMLLVPAITVHRWSRRYLRPGREYGLAAARLELARLIPLPDAIRCAFALDLATKTWTKRGQPLDASLMRRRHMVLQRLLAYQLAHHSLYNRRHVDLLVDISRQRKHLPASSRPTFGAVLARTCLYGPLWQTRATQEGFTRASSRVERALEMVRCASCPQAFLLERERMLRPDVLVSLTPCQACGSFRRLTGTDTDLPPFHATCLCTRVQWVSTCTPELERKVMLWEVAASLPFYRVPPFPLEEFLVACGQAEQQEVKQPAFPDCRQSTRAAAVKPVVLISENWVSQEGQPQVVR
jgi:hypothetical protein